MRIVLFLILVLCASLVIADIRINEIMYNPDGNDNNNEFIEICSDTSLNLSDFIIMDEATNDSLELLQYYDSDYYLIVEEGFNYSGIEASIYSAGTTIGNNLNTEDSLFLIYSNGTIIANVSYTDDCGSGYSLEYFNGSFYCSFYLGGTPGRVNSNKNQDYSNLIINELFVDPSGDDNAAMPAGEFIEIYNSGEEIDLIAAYLIDSSNHKLDITDTNVIDGTIIGSGEYLVVYMNGFSGFLNNDNLEEIKFYDPYGNLIDEVSYSYSEEDISWSLVNGLWQLRLATPGLKNYEEEPERESSFEIEDIEGSSNIEFGDIIKVKLNIYKGDSSKESIKLYVENDDDRISKITKANLPDKFEDYSFTLPIQLYSNCKGSYSDGDYEIKVGWTSGSITEDSFSIEVEDNNEEVCDKIYIEKEPRKAKLEYNLLECSGSVYPGDEIVSKIELVNNDDEDHMVDIHSYVYKGSKCYSGNREDNLKKVLVKSGQSKEFELLNVVDEAEEGDYKLKIRVKRDDQKTTKEITEDIKLLALPLVEKEETLFVASEIQEESNDMSAVLDDSCGSEVKLLYESTGTKSRNLVSTLIIIVLTLLCVFLIWKRSY